MSDSKVREVASGLIGIAFRGRKGVRFLTEDELLIRCKCYVRLRKYGCAGETLREWLKYNQSDKASKLLDNLKGGLRLSKVKGKLYEKRIDPLLGPFAPEKNKLIGTEETTFDEHGNIVEHVEKSGFKIDEYYRREYEYQNGDVPVRYTQYDKDGNVTEIYTAVLTDDGKLDSDKIEHPGSKCVKERKYVYDSDGLLGRVVLYEWDHECGFITYTYDDLDRVTSEFHACNGEYTSYDYKYVRHSTRVTQTYSERNNVKYEQQKDSDFMGNIYRVEKFVKRSDCGWVSFGYFRTFDNIYVRI